MIDLTWVALSPFGALFIRDNFGLWAFKVQDLMPYALLCVVSAAAVFACMRLHRVFWRYISLMDVLRIIGAVLIALLLAVLGAFVFNRLEGVPRSLPVIQAFLLIAAMVGSRVAIRLAGERRSRPKLSKAPPQKEHVLVVGVNELTKLYLHSVAEVAPANFVIVGILSPYPDLQGRLMHNHKVLGRPEEIGKILDQLAVHGVTIDRIVVTKPFERLSKHAQDALRTVEATSAIRVEWLIESLGLRKGGVATTDATLIAESRAEMPVSAAQQEHLLLSHYHRLKRVVDGTVAFVMIVALTPVLTFTALVVALDVGLPLLFWQQRPGRHGHAFKLYKFRTMREAHDKEGNRIPDELRSSSVGRFLRRTWLDELPQLYNILVGEMSFVGPRPLLPVDQPQLQNSRLTVRPGLTGWAQINGGRDIPPNYKAMLDEWYINNASLWLDAKILLRTCRLMVAGEAADSVTVSAANSAMEAMKRRTAVEGEPTLTTELSRMSANGAQAH
jgi:lipopolysaccharide/colanic/teichoic acid biosynthesis glycosyltransferase